MARFLKPTTIKLIFLVEWTLFILIELFRGELGSRQQILVASYPLAFFYLVACWLTVLSQRTQRLASGRTLLGLAIVLTLVDQFSKALVVNFIPYQASVPIIDGWLHLAHEYNFQGSWIAAFFELEYTNHALFIVLIVFFLLCSGFGYRYYNATHRQSVWADVAFLGLFAGLTSWDYDMVFRGRVVDFIQLPGVVTADLKDILLAVGVAAFFAEGFDNPEISWRWKGWRKEGEALVQSATSVVGYLKDELQGARRMLQRVFGKSAGKSR